MPSIRVPRCTPASSAPPRDTCPLPARDHAAPGTTLALAKAAGLGCERVRPLAWCSRPRSWTASREGALMFAFVVRRVIGLVIVLFAITVMTFLIFFATPGVDPSRQFAGRNPDPTVLAQIKHQFGLDRSLPVQYALMMKRLFISRDLTSYGNTAVKVVPAIVSAAPVTFSLVFGAAILWVVGSIFLGLVMVTFKGRFVDPLLMVLALIGISIPVFWLG